MHVPSSFTAPCCAAASSAYDNTMVVRVKNGDYLTSLARQYNTTVSAILAANDLTNQDRLDPNTELIIPTLP